MFGDAVVSYATPVFLEEALTNTFHLGLVMSFSSMVGFLIDILAGKFFKKRGYGFFVWGTILTALAFSASFLALPKNVLVYLFAMGLWGIYYEFEAFSKFTYVKECTGKHEYSMVWGIFSNLSAIAYLLGPALASFLISKSLNISFVTSIILSVLSGVFFLIFKLVKKEKVENLETEVKHRITVHEELLVWGKLFKKIWFIWFFNICLVSIDAAFWTVGIIYAEKLKETHPFGWAFLWAYMLPSTFMGFFLPKVAKKFGKKKSAFIGACLGGMSLFTIGFVESVYLQILLMFVFSVFTSLSFPAIYATFEDYISRLHDFGTEMMGIEQTSGSVAYIIGPAVFGFLAEVIGIQKIFSVGGVLIFVVSFLGLIIVPRKIHLPQKELEEIGS